MPSFIRASRRATESPRVSIVVPALNEAANLAELLPLLPEVHEVILVDGGSVDETVSTARRLRPDVVIVLQARLGKGNALASGFARVTGDIVVMLDADGSADPAEIDGFVQALRDGADVAKGSRFTAGGGSADITRIRSIGNKGLSMLFNLGFGSRYTDLCYGFNAFWADLIPLLDLPDHASPCAREGQMQWGDGFEIETLIDCRFAAAGLNVAEVPSLERLRIHGVSHLNAVTDGLRVLRTLMIEWLRFRLAVRRAVTAPIALKTRPKSVAAA